MGRGQQGGKEIFIPCQDQRQDECRHHAGQGDGQHDGRKGPPDGQAIDQGGLLQFGGDPRELVAHDPDHDGQDRQCIQQDQPDPCVEQGQFPVKHEERQGQDHRRQDQLRQEKERNIGVAHIPELVAEPRQPIGGKAAQQHRKGGGCGRGDDRIDEPLEEFVAHRVLGPERVGRQAQCLPADPGWLIIHPGDHVALHHVRGHLEAGGDGPVDREQTDEGPQDQRAIDRNPPGPPLCAVGQVGMTVMENLSGHARARVIGVSSSARPVSSAGSSR